MLTGLLAVLAVLLVLSSFNIGVRSYVVSSGSMSPALSTGSLVFVSSAKDYRVGDIITFKSKTGNKYTTHRIVEVTKNGEHISYKTKGDANESPDSDPVPQDRVVGRVVFHISRLGYLMSFLRTKVGLILFVVAIALVIALLLFEKKPDTKEKKGVPAAQDPPQRQ